ncbi:MAG: type II toxin-antitoxin system HicB family antitoxin [Candidatus Omnitrophica bacterium]|nr:type II toxin-antitoxin system HicB family antitoxin [Candidatus Omnitrophota bacterium]
MIDMMQYKGYYGSVHYSDEDKCFFGKIEHIRDLVSYEGHDVATLKKAFEDGVTDYLKTCKAKNKAPDKPFKGSFNIRTGPELHRLAYIYAQEKKMNLNQVVISALEDYLPRPHNVG